MTYDGTQVSAGGNTIFSIGLEETAWGTAAAAEMWTGAIENMIATREDLVVNLDGLTGKRTKTNHIISASRYPVSISGKLTSGVPLAAILGYISATSNPTLSILRGASHPTPTKVYLPSWTCRRSYQGESDNLEILGVTFNESTFTSDLDGFWIFELNGTGKSRNTTAVTGVAVPTRALGSWNTEFKIDEDSTTYSDGGAFTIEGLSNLSFSINNNLDIRNEFGKTSPVSIRQPKPFKSNITLSFTRGHVDNDVWTRLADGGVNSFRINITDGSTTIQIDFQNCLPNSTENVTPFDGKGEDTIELSVIDIVATITNDGVTYIVWD